MRRVMPAVFLLLLAPAAARADATQGATTPPAATPTPNPTPTPASTPPPLRRLPPLGSASVSSPSRAPPSPRGRLPRTSTPSRRSALSPSTNRAPASSAANRRHRARVPSCAIPADTVAAIHGDDAPSRALLGGVARRFNLRGVVVVRPVTGSSPATARVFLAATDTFDAASYSTDDVPASAPPGPPSWSAAAGLLARAYGQVPAAPLATHELPPADGSSSRDFYESGWFWGALGLAALAGGAVFFATRDSSTPTIDLEAQVPH